MMVFVFIVGAIIFCLGMGASIHTDLWGWSVKLWPEVEDV